MTCKRLLLCSLCCLLCCAPALCLGAAVSDGVVPDGTPDKPRASEGAVSDGVVPDGTVSDGAVDKPGAVSDGVVSDGAVPAQPGGASDGVTACTPATPRPKRCCPPHAPKPTPRPNVPLPLWVSVPETGSPKRAAMFVCILGGACCLLTRMIACNWRRW